MRSDAGFSLIEMLVALTVMALASGLALLTMSSGASLASETDRFIAALEAARDQSIIENRIVQVEVSEAGYSSSVRRRLGPALPDAAPATWEQGTSVATAGGELPVVMSFDPVGLTEPAEFTLFRGRSRERVTVDGSGEIARAGDAP
jgi:general secretion pathway protein H